MATIANDKLTLVDLAKRLKPDKSLDMIVEILEEDQEILQDMPWVQANQVTGHRTTIRAGLPSGTFRKLNSGVPTEKSKTVQITETIGMLETYLEVDKKLAQLSGNVNEFRAQESRSAIEGMSQTLATSLFYSDVDTEPEKFLGLEARYDDALAGNAANILDAGGSGSDNSSIWIINWRPDKIHGIYSRGSAVGLQHEDLGEERVYDANNNSYQALVSHLTMDIGLCVRDWRYAVRICNIDDSALTKDASGSSADLVDLISAGVERLKDMNGAVRMYCTQNVRSYLRRQIKNTNNVLLGQHEAFGAHVLQVDGIPVRRTHALKSTEAQVTGL